MLKLFLWLKYLKRRRIIFLSIAAVAVSVSLLIVVASLFTGFINSVERSAVEMLGDVILIAPAGRPFEDYPAFIQMLEENDVVEAATGTLWNPGLVHLGKGDVRSVAVWGIEPGSRARVAGLKDALLRQGDMETEPTFDAPGRDDGVGGYVGIGVVAEADRETDQYDQEAILDEMIGRRVIVTTGIVGRDDAAETTLTRKVMKFYIADVVFTGVHDLDTRFVYVPIRALQEKLYPGTEDVALATTINVKLRPGADPDLAVTLIRGLWRTFAPDKTSFLDMPQVTTALEMQERYIKELRKQMGVLLLIFGVVSFSVIVLVFCIFYMIVRLKRRDIAIVKSCGASGTSVAWIFLNFGMSVGVVGAGIGTVLGYVIIKNINAIERAISVAFGLKLWSSSTYMFTKIPSEVDWASALPIVGLAIAAAAIGALTPAAIAALTRPVDVLRYE